jgi:hypothetical protein
MTYKVGGHDLQSLLQVTNVTLAQYGLGFEGILEVVRNELATHNQLVQEAVADFCEVTTDRMRPIGQGQTGSMYEVDEFGRAPTQRDVGSGMLALPLRKFQFAVGWTDLWFETKTPADLALQLQNSEKAHIRRVLYELKRAVYFTGNFTFRDFLVDQVDLPVKRFANADGMYITEGPNTEIFDGTTHTHYSANATLTDPVLLATVNTVAEHGWTQQLRLYINAANEAAVRALPSFQAYQDPRVALGVTTSRIEQPRLNITRMDNRAIGIFGLAEVWVKPWALPNYYLASDTAGLKPLGYRQRSQATLQGLRLDGELRAFPLNTKYLTAEFGLGAINRTKAAILFVGGGTYIDPTLTAP